MIPIDVPPISTQETFRECRQRTQPYPDADELEQCTTWFKRVESRYIELAASNRLHAYGPAEASPLEDSKLRGMFDNHLVRGSQRSVYDHIRSVSPYGLCAYCNQRVVGSLDHYLPRSAFPELSILLANLVPSCTDCNSAKHEHAPSGPNDEPFHPYFNDWTHTVALRACVQCEDRQPVKIQYSIVALDPSDEDLQARAENHIRLMRLRDLYQINAQVELAQRAEYFAMIHSAIGPDGLASELLKEAASRASTGGVSWQHALYVALAGSEQFCEYGYRSVAG